MFTTHEARVLFFLGLLSTNPCDNLQILTNKTFGTLDEWLLYNALLLVHLSVGTYMTPTNKLVRFCTSF